MSIVATSSPVYIVPPFFFVLAVQACILPCSPSAPIDSGELSQSFQVGSAVERVSFGRSMCPATKEFRQKNIIRLV